MKPLVRVLLVTDDFGGPGNPPFGGYLRWQDQSASAAIGTSSREFHLGEFVKVLEETPWLGFNVELTKAHRSLPGTGGMNEAALKADRGADVVGFRFNQPFTVAGATRTLSDYDMALFFSIEYGNPNSALAAEAEAIASFMEAGGGFFATGDHANLGATLCGLIPRVRSMRRWWNSAGPNGEPAAPSPIGATRHDTTRAGADNVTHFEDQSDEFAQPITPALYNAGFTVKQGYPATKYLPHQLLCSPDGQVKWLPDHMHEGWCEVPGQLETRTFTLNAANVREYPDYTPDNPPPGFVPEPLAPEVVATGQVLPGVTSPALDMVHTGGTAPAQGKTFGVIGAWDGHRVGKGRVVVDATWHHFFDINISGDRYLENNSLGSQHEQKLHGFFVPDGSGGRIPNAHYRMIMWYFRNIIYWLIPADRYQSIWWWSLIEIVKRPQLSEELSGYREARAFETLHLEHYFYFGQLAESYFNQARGHCATYDIHRYLYKPKIPWWEWIQEVVDVWDPVREIRGQESIRHEQWLGAVGIAPRQELATQLSLGAAVIAAASVQALAMQGADTARLMKAVQKVWPAILNHAVREFGKHLRVGAKVQKEVEKIVAEQLQATSSKAAENTQTARDEVTS